MLLPQVSAAFQEQTEYCLTLERGYKIQMEQLVSRFHRGAIDESEFEQQRSESLRSYQEDVETCARTAQLHREIHPHRPVAAPPARQGRGIASVTAENNSYYTHTENTMYEEIQSANDDIYEDME